MYKDLQNRFKLNVLQLKNLGVYGTFIFKLFRFFQNQKIFLESNLSKYPLAYRPYTSDLSVFHQIFVEREYAPLDGIKNVDLVIDCGANVGYSSAYFLTTFPECQVIAVEPEPSNFALMSTNLKPYNERVNVVNAGVWSHSTNLKISEIPYGDGLQWSTQVRECGPDELADFKAVDIGTLLKGSGKERISILKVDIEGAEAIVFGKNYESWLPFVDNIVIELHENTCFGDAPTIFFDAISKKSFDITRHGELVVCRDLSLFDNVGKSKNNYYRYE